MRIILYSLFFFIISFSSYSQRIKKTIGAVKNGKLFVADIIRTATPKDTSYELSFINDEFRLIVPSRDLKTISFEGNKTLEKIKFEAFNTLATKKNSSEFDVGRHKCKMAVKKKEPGKVAIFFGTAFFKVSELQLKELFGEK